MREQFISESQFNLKAELFLYENRGQKIERGLVGETLIRNS